IFSTPLTTTDRQALENNQFSYYASTDAKLSTLSTTAGTLSPVFASATTAYTANVPNATTSITVTPTVNDVTATVRINGTTVTSGTASGAIALNVGNNTITVLVTAQNGTTTQSYTLTVTRASAATAPVPMSPTFVASNTNYAASISDITENVRITPTVAQANSTVQVRSNGGVYATITSGTSSPFLDMNLESNVIDVKVTAIDGTTIKIYSITVTKVKSNQFGPISYSGSKGFQNLMDGSHNEWTMSSAASQGNRVSVIAVQPVVDADLSGLSLESVEPTVLPVDLISFDAKVSNSGTVNLSWSTSSEEKNSRFEVLRSLNGIDFTPLATVNGKQNATDGERKYRVTDANPFQGNNYYQLIQYDTDGKSKSLGVRMVEVNLETLNAVSVYPNPSTGIFNLALSPSLPNSGSVNIYTFAGRKVASQLSVIGNRHYQVNISNQPNGMYILNLQSGGQSMNVRLVKQ
ncbi:MAG: T9SS type A sorting domain-containing protein, partial [Pedobacter sp.]